MQGVSYTQRNVKVVTSMVSDLASTFLNEVNSSSIQFLFLRFVQLMKRLKGTSGGGPKKDNKSNKDIT